MNRIKVIDEELVLPEGTTYKILVLKNCEKLTLNTMKRIHEISKLGVPIVGEKPTKIASYSPSYEDVKIFNKLVDEIWSNPRTYADYNWEKIMNSEGLSSDFEVSDREDITFIHRNVRETDIYFTYNPDSIPRQIEYTFRVNKKIPELWNPLNGETKKKRTICSK